MRFSKEEIFDRTSFSGAVKLEARLKGIKGSLGREEVQMLSTGDSLEAFCYKEQRNGSVGGGGVGCRKGF